MKERVRKGKEREVVSGERERGKGKGEEQAEKGVSKQGARWKGASY